MKLKARPTTYRGITMRSRLEARFAAHLDGLGVQWTFEPMCFADGAGQYLPDFRIDCEDQVYVEVKPDLDPAAFGSLPAHRWLEIIRASEPDAVLILALGFVDYWMTYSFPFRDDVACHWRDVLWSVP